MTASSQPTVALVPASNGFEERLTGELKRLSRELSTLNPKQNPKGKIHDLRVLGRRLQAYFMVMEEAGADSSLLKFKKPVRKMTRALSPIRSLEVSLKDLKKILQNPESPLPAGLRLLAKPLKKKHKKLKRKALRKISRSSLSEKLSKAEGTSGHLDAHALQQALTGRISLSEARAAKDLKAFRERPKVEFLHRLRISVKKWRYLTEIRTSCFAETPRDATPLKQMKEIQNRLGRIHDLSVLKETLKKERILRMAKKEGLKGPLKKLRKEIKTEVASCINDFKAEGTLALESLLKGGAA